MREIKNVVVVMLLVLFISIIGNPVFATKYDEENFKIEIPTNYKQVVVGDEKNKIYTYVNEANKDISYMIFQNKDTSYAKEFKDVDSLPATFRGISKYENKKFNGYDAIYTEMEKGKDYMQMYLVYSNNYNYGIAVIGNKDKIVDSKEVKEVYKSFKIKDSRFNIKSVVGLLTIIALAIAVIKQYKSKIIKVENNIGVN